jgi:hypothetical protein
MKQTREHRDWADIVVGIAALLDGGWTPSGSALGVWTAALEGWSWAVGAKIVCSESIMTS